LPGITHDHRGFGQKDGFLPSQLAFVPPNSTPAPVAGKIAVFDMPLTIVPFSFFTVLAYPGREYSRCTRGI